MGNFDGIKATINANIKTNGQQEITGNVLNHVLNGMVSATETQVVKLSNEIKGISPAPMVSVTHAELVSLRDGGKLIPGMQYRITDYVTTTTQVNTRSAGHQFDIIVTADNENTLNEVARACLHDGDTYFSQAGANLAAWKIWYCLDNDRERFVWACDTGKILVSCRVGSSDTHELDGKIVAASDFGEDYEIMGEKVLYAIDLYDRGRLYLTDRNNIWDEGEAEIGGYDTVNAKGVIYRMIDEWNNDCPYDFKNILFKRGLYAGGGGLAKSAGDEDIFVSCYTFSWQSEEYETIDASIWGNTMNLQNDEGFPGGVYNNVIKSLTDREQKLNNIVFLSTYAYEDRIFYGCKNNCFGLNCHDNSFGNFCNENKFGSNCSNNHCGDEFNSNTIGENSAYNVFANTCYNNTFGSFFIENNIELNCSMNEFDSDCQNNIIGGNCQGNSFGNGCSNITLSEDCHGNRFECSCGNIRLVSKINGVIILPYVQDVDIDRSDIICAKNSNGSVRNFYLGDLADLLN